MVGEGRPSTPSTTITGKSTGAPNTHLSWSAKADHPRLQPPAFTRP